MSTTTHATFPNADGQSLSARLALPIGAPRAYALFAHCFACEAGDATADRVTVALVAEGIAVLRFDFTGLGDGGGGADFASSVEDVLAAADYLRGAHEAPRILVGHSLGGAAVLAAARGVPEAMAVVTINAPTDPEELGRLVDGASGGAALGDARFVVKPTFLDAVGAEAMHDALRGLTASLLVFQASGDAFVSMESARRLVDAAPAGASLITLEGDHHLSARADAMFVGSVLAAFIANRLGEEPPHETAENDSRAIVEESGEGKYAQNVRIGRHRLLADEPTGFGGDDLGPSPYEYLLAGLGACTSMTLRLYADRKGWPLERVHVALHHEKRHAEDCAECETKKGKIDHIHRHITLDGPLDAEQRARLIEIANKCPVHQTLHAEVRVETREVVDRGDVRAS